MSRATTRAHCHIRVASFPSRSINAFEASLQVWRKMISPSPSICSFHRKPGPPVLTSTHIRAAVFRLHFSANPL